MMAALAPPSVSAAPSAWMPPQYAHPRILHIVPALLGPGGIYGGAERFALEMSRAMAPRYPTRLAGFGRRAERTTEGPLAIHTLRNWLRTRRFAGSPAGPALLRHLHWADLIQVHQPHTMGGTLALAYTRLFRKPVFALDNNGGGLCLQSFVDTRDWYDGYLWVSEYARAREAFRPRDVVIWGGVDPARFCPDPRVERTGEVLYLGRLIATKGADDLIDAVDAGTPLTIMGPAYDAEFAAELHRLAAGKQVRFLPPGGDAEIRDAYRRALCFVLPSTRQARDGRPNHGLPEPLGLTLIEAMACGTPAICTRVGGMPEIVADGETGFVVPEHDPAALGEKIQWLRQHPAEARAMGEAARRRVLEMFTWEKVAERCYVAYGLADRAQLAPVRQSGRGMHG